MLGVVVVVVVAFDAAAATAANVDVYDVRISSYANIVRYTIFYLFRTCSTCL